MILNTNLISNVFGRKVEYNEWTLVFHNIQITDIMRSDERTPNTFNLKPIFKITLAPPSGAIILPRYKYR